jgi:hypothetical protein
MGFHVEVNAILRSDEYDPAGLKPGAACRFVKDGSRLFFDGQAMWLTRMDWTPLAEIRVVSQTRDTAQADRPRVEGTFQVLYVYPPDEQAMLKAVFKRMFGWA